MKIIFDLIVLAIVLTFIIISARKGFVKSFVEVLGFVAALFLATYLSTPIAGFVYDRVIEPPIMSAVGEKTGDTIESASDDQVLRLFPKFVSENSEKLGISVSQFKNEVSNNITSGVNSAVKTASQKTIRPAVVKVLSMAIWLGLFVVLIFVSKKLAKLLNKIFSISIVGKVNSILGGTIGLVKGIVFAVVFCAISALIVSFSKNGFLIFTKTNLNNSYFFKWVVNTLPFKIFRI